MHLRAINKLPQPYGLKTFGLKSSLMFTCSLLLAGATAAQENEAASNEDDFWLEEIVVTATKTGASSVQDTALSLSAFTGNDIRRSGINDISDVSAYTPGLTYTANSVWSVITIRGIGTNNTFVGGDPSTTMQMDGVYMGRATSGDLDLIDIDRIEVLRGPQGTLYGRNATGGTINVITRDPSEEFEGIIRGSIGNRKMFGIEGRLSGPVIGDKVLASFSGAYKSQNGFIENITQDIDDLGEYDRITLRGKLKFLVSDSISLTLGGDYFKADELVNFYSIRTAPVAIDDGFTPEHFEIATNDPNTSDVEIWGIQGKLEAELNENYTLTSLTAYRDSFTNTTLDLDATNVELAHTRWFPEDQNQFSQEFNLNGTFENLRFVAGLFYFKEEADTFFTLEVHDVANPGPSAGDYTQTSGTNTDTRSLAAYTQGTYDLTESFSVTAGIRYSHDRKTNANRFGASVGPIADNLDPSTLATGTAFGPEAQEDYSAWTPKLGLEFRPSDSLLLYASATKGFKSGGFNTISAGAPVEYGDETVWAYEAGIKTRFADGRVNASVSAFSYDYSGYQVLQFLGTGTEFITNADSVKLHGMELELNASITTELRAGGTLALLSTKYDSAFQTTDVTIGQPVDVQGNKLSNAPGTTSTLYIEYEAPVGESDWMLLVRGNASYKDDVFFSPSNNGAEFADSYWLLNLHATLYDSLDERWEFSLIGKNLANEQYLEGVNNFITPIGRPGEARTIMFMAGYKF